MSNGAQQIAKDWPRWNKWTAGINKTCARIDAAEVT